MVNNEQAEDTHKAELKQAFKDKNVDLVALEKDKIKGAIRTDFILSAEIIVIALGTVTASTFMMQVFVVSLIALGVTFIVYGLVAGIVKLDDAGFHLCEREVEGAWPSFVRWFGAQLVAFAPWLMKALAIVGTIAMFMVGGGILTHGFKAIHHLIENSAEHTLALPYIGTVLAGLLPTLLDAAFGILAGGLVFAAIELGKRLFKRRSETA